MAAFEYTALDKQGAKCSGVVEADSSKQVRQVLRDKGLVPLAVDEANSKKNTSQKAGGLSISGSKQGLKVADLALITRQMATLIQAGLPIEEVLKAVSDQTDKAKVTSMMLSIRAKVLEGHTLANSLAEYPKAFPILYRSTVSAGEQSGFLGPVLEKLADYTEERQASRQKIMLALLYPVLLLFVGFAIVAGLLAFVVPDVVKVFTDSGQELPGMTLFLLSVSDFMVDYGWLLIIAIVLLILLFQKLLTVARFKLLFDSWLLTVPLVKKIVLGGNVARYTSTLSILTSSGVPLVDAMKIAHEVVSNASLQQAVQEAMKRVSEGSSLKLALDKTGKFPPMMIHMIASGESSGELDAMLNRCADGQERDLQSLVATIVGLFEPIMLLVMGGAVLFIVLAIMMPILQMNQLVN